MAGKSRFTRLERFEAKYEPCPTTGCWIWTAGLAKGYGHFVWETGKRVNPKSDKKTGTVQHNAHHAAWLLYRGEIPEGLEVRHTCGLKCCVNPDHLRLGTHQQNLSDLVLVRGAGRKPRLPESKYGVHKLRNRFQARVNFGMKTECYGWYDSAEEAHVVATRETERLHRQEAERPVEEFV